MDNSQHVLVPGVAPAQVQDLALPLAGSNEIDRFCLCKPQKQQFNACDRPCSRSNPYNGPCSHSSPCERPQSWDGEPNCASVSCLVSKMKQWMKKSGLLESGGTPTETGEEEEVQAGYCKVTGTSEEQEDKEEDIIQASIATQSLSQDEIQDMQKDFSHRPGEHLVTSLLR